MHPRNHITPSPSRQRYDRRFLQLMATALALLSPAMLPATTAAQPPPALHPTPEILTLTEVDLPGAVAFVARTRMHPTQTILGLSLLCKPPPSPKIEITAYFGGYPADRRPVQFALRTPDLTVLRFGPVERGSPASGFHSPRITAPREARRFLSAALQTGTLVSNGYRSFRNQIPPDQNRAFHKHLLDCMDTPAQ